MRRAVVTAQGDWWPGQVNEVDDAAPFPGLHLANRNAQPCRFGVRARRKLALRYKEPGTSLGPEE